MLVALPIPAKNKTRSICEICLSKKLFYHIQLYKFIRNTTFFRFFPRCELWSYLQIIFNGICINTKITISICKTEWLNTLSKINPHKYFLPHIPLLCNNNGINNKLYYFSLFFCQEKNYVAKYIVHQ